MDWMTWRSLGEGENVGEGSRRRDEDVRSGTGIVGLCGRSPHKGAWASLLPSHRLKACISPDLGYDFVARPSNMYPIGLGPFM